MNKFEQVSSDDYQMSVTGGGSGGGYPISQVWGKGRVGLGILGSMSKGPGTGVSRSHVQREEGVPYHVTYPMIHVILPKRPPWPE